MLQYIRKGTGEVLVFVHGFLGAKEIFSEVIDELSSHFDCIAVDLPGHGESKLEKESYSVYDYARAVADILAHEEIKEATWLGHSMGGYIVLAAIEKEIAPINRAILAYSSDLADTDEQIEKRTNQQQQIADDGVEHFVNNVLGAFFSENPNEEHVNYARNIAYNASEEGLVMALETMKNRPNQHELVEQLKIPILVIEGSEDAVVKPVETNNPNVKKVMTKTGHLGMLEDSQTFIRTIREFMA
ncbi:pimeloyl-ACP methyl ester carboxylesterase [Ureibacillus xyleni]|uniref:Pimeloyl-ACP methyl ester carboxylesterase n=1 Tax=Ureibacillus xyleni TaxID=614648 RepID=A0A285S3A9_9BACL|nr:alpha/beta fold hydrolase [Ureibacillus xyleni]SOB99414.1 pimeloyl-ACP methyl ester carboxylesterase [Ureibacillus xyleni]